ncbi:MAG: YeiH family putative sulfate export transporter [Stenotrophomonas nitritireducens]|nr:YeiH family putative sulfate export transporter [Stenotrophomonas sp.]MBN8793123.1 YeiH family putative sulfate export transporter [Stenotrophomonas nitritireducens]
MNTAMQGPAPARRSRFLPGLLLTLAIAGLSIWLGTLPWLQAHGISALTLAIVIGIALGNTVYGALAPRAAAGVGFSKATLLRAGIILYGLRLTLQDIGQVGASGVVIDALVLCSTFALAWWLGCRVLGLERNTALLIGAGSSICGAAAVMAAEPVVKGRAEQVAVAVATVVVFGTLAMFLYPLLYQWGVAAGWMPLDETGFGVFTGSTVHEVAQVVAAGRAVSKPAADAAVIAKMVRVMMLAPFLVGLSALLARGRPAGDGQRSKITVPWFAFGFIAMVGFNSLQLLPTRLVATLVDLDTVLLAMAMAALGLTTHVSALRQAGARPMLLAVLLFAWLMGGGMLINLGVRALL